MKIQKNEFHVGSLFSIFFIGSNGGFSVENVWLILSAAFSIAQILRGMTNALVALYNLKRPLIEQKDPKEMQQYIKHSKKFKPKSSGYSM